MKQPSTTSRILYISRSLKNSNGDLHYQITRNSNIKDGFELPFEADFLVCINIDFQALKGLEKRDISFIFKECNRTLQYHGAVYINGTNNKEDTSRYTQIAKKSGFENSEVIKSSFDSKVYISNKRLPHTIDLPPNTNDFKKKCDDFRKTHREELPGSFSYIIAVYNEASNLPVFLLHLEKLSNALGSKREFIFVINGCTDDSEKMIKEFAQQTTLNVKIVYSEKGILNAFKKGIVARSLDGFIGRFDADILLHQYTLDLMEMHLYENQEAKVTYAEPVTTQRQTLYNLPVFKPKIVSKRLYFTGKTCLFRDNPNTIYNEMTDDLIADDIYPSFYFIYCFGFGSISRTPGAVAYEKVIDNFNDLVQQLSRSSSEVDRIFRAFPHLQPLGKIVEQVIDPKKSKDYFDLVEKAKDEKKYVSGWTRLESTK